MHESTSAILNHVRVRESAQAALAELWKNFDLPPTRHSFNTVFERLGG